MTRPPTVKISREEIQALFIEYSIRQRIDRQELTNEPEVEKDAPARIAPGGVSRIVKHSDASGYHIATSHVIIDQSGEIVHRDAKDVLIAGIRYTRP